MSRSRGAMLAAPSVVPLAIGLLVAAGLVLLAGLIDPGGRATTARVAPSGAAPPGCGPDAFAGARWWRLVPVTGPTGGLAGWTLRLGARDGHVSSLPLPAESFVGGPVGGVVVVAADDGRSSSIRRLGSEGCRDEIAEVLDVVRAVAPDPTGRRLAIHLVDRASRADHGVRVIDATSGAELATVAAPEPSSLAGAGLERPWRTLLSWDRSGERLAIASCEPGGCLTRVADAASGRVVAEVSGTADPVVLDGDRLVAWDRCLGLPCPLLAVDLGDGQRTALASEALAATSVGPGRIALTSAERPDRVRVVRLDGRTATVLAPILVGRTLWSGPTRSGAGVELPDGWFPLASEGRDPERAVRAVDGAAARLEEVTP